MMQLAPRVVLAVAAGFISSAAAAQAPRPAPPPAPAAMPTAARPLGATIKCRDESWAPPASDASACASHGGVKYRFVEKVPPPPAKTRPDAGQTRATTPPPPSKNAIAPAAQAVQAASATQRARDAGAAKAPTGPPPDATLLCKDGTYLSGSADAARCAAHGGFVAKLPKPRP
ncbi:MAG: hypothetical protein Q8K55_07110 [Gemmatimonadaceae bacterium]|nr:hypothetical protein [Gemmatimonadaceae bacterium]